MKITIASEEQWHSLRAKNVGGSEVGALFGVSPFITAYSLWHEKAGKVPPEFVKENERMRWGKLLEPLIGQEMGRKLNWKITPARHYITHDTVAGMGCSLDFDVVDHEWGPGIVETKVVFDYSDYMRDWSDDRAPPSYELQMQHQLACTGYSWGAIVLFCAQTGTLQPALIRRPNEKATAAILEKVVEFWDTIRAGTPPSATGTDREAAIVRELYPAREPKKVVTIADPALAEAASLYIWAAEQLPGITREKDTRKTQIIAAAKDAEILKVPGYDIYIKQSKSKAITLDVRQVDNGVVADPALSTLTAA